MQAEAAIQARLKAGDAPTMRGAARRLEAKRPPMAVDTNVLARRRLLDDAVQHKQTKSRQRTMVMRWRRG